MTTNLLNVPFDPELTAGARNAVRVCLAIQPTERVTLDDRRSHPRDRSESRP